MNWFMLIGGALWLGAAVQAHFQSNWQMVIVSIAYAISQFALATVR